MEEKEIQNIESNTLDNTPEESEKQYPAEKKQKNKSKLLLAILTTIGIVIIAYLVFYFKTANPKQVLVKSLNLWTESLEIFTKPLNGTKSIDFEEMTIKGIGTIQLGEIFTNEAFLKQAEGFAPIINKLNSLSFGVEMQLSKTKKKAFVNVFSDMEQQKLFDIIYASQDQKNYILFKGVLEKYLQLEQAQDIFGSDIDTQKFHEDVRYVQDVLKKSLKKNIKSSYIKTENETVTIDGKEMNTTKISLVIDQNVDMELTSAIVKDLKADKRANDFITSFYPEFKDYEVVKSESNDTISYSVNITKGLHKVVKTAMTMDNNSISLVKGKENVITIMEDGKLLITSTLKEETDGFQMILKSIEQEDFEIILTGKKEEENAIYNLIAKSAGTGVEVKITINQKQIKKNETYKQTAEIACTVKSNGVSVPVATLKFDFDITKGAKFEDIKDAILITELSEEEQKKITTYFESIAQKFIQ